MKLTQRLRALGNSAQQLGGDQVCQHAFALEKEVRAALEQRSARDARLGKLHQELQVLDEQFTAGTLDYSQFSVLYVDDEVTSLKCFARAYGKAFQTLTAPNAAEALKILKEPKHRVAVTLANHHMPGKDGPWLLHQIRQLQPRLTRILVSTFPSTDDLLAARAAADSGAIHSYIVEPWDPMHMEHLLKRAFEYFILREALHMAAWTLADSGSLSQAC
jgi:response regulator RpfG family c-di-GMP phosphodiesterase